MKVDKRRVFPYALVLLFFLLMMLFGSFPRLGHAASRFSHDSHSTAGAAVPSFSHVRKEPPPEQPLAWNLQIYVNGKYYTTDETKEDHLKMRKGDKLTLEAKWEGGPLHEGYAIHFSDGGSPLGTGCEAGATSCTFIDSRNYAIPGRWYFAELWRPAPFGTDSTYQNNRVYVDWID